MKRKDTIKFTVMLAGLVMITLSHSACTHNKVSDSSMLIEASIPYEKKEKIGDYWEYTCPTPNVHAGKNQVKAIVLHHTATESTLSSLKIMTGPKPTGKVSCHVVIAPDGTRYILAPPESITWHAGWSMLNGRSNCNRFTVGIEFQGNTLEHPLTSDQIQSAIDYCLPIMKKYNLKISDIVTHKQIREEYLRNHHAKKVPAKPDITDEEHNRFKKAIKEQISANVPG
ncbi:MAG: N-acetylmuramoyl-L-alanine amidase [Muribaculaceae bacterium]|nr:N-acetylmuramoyl-L-alanine amidase [Muribaculaceae bacterium]